MALPSSGALSFYNVQTEMGGSSPIALTEYYGWSGLPSSGTIKVSDFYGKAKPSGTVTWLNAGTFSWHVPDGVTSVRCRMIGGGEGGRSNSSSNWSGGGYAGAIKDQYVAVTPNTNVTVIVGVGGATNGGNGGTSRFHTITASGGSGANIGAGTSSRYNGNNQTRSTPMGTFRNGYSNYQWYGGQAGFGHGGDAQRTRPAPRSPHGTRGGGGGSASPNYYTAGRGGAGLVRIDWG